MLVTPHQWCRREPSAGHQLNNWGRPNLIRCSTSRRASVRITDVSIRRAESCSLILGHAGDAISGGLLDARTSFPQPPVRSESGLREPRSPMAVMSRHGASSPVTCLSLAHPVDGLSISRDVACSGRHLPTWLVRRCTHTSHRSCLHRHQSVQQDSPRRFALRGLDSRRSPRRFARPQLNPTVRKRMRPSEHNCPDGASLPADCLERLVSRKENLR